MNLHETAFPTFPMQTNLGQTIVQFGFTKVELATIIIASQMDKNLLPETIAQASYEIASEILKHCDNEIKKDTEQPTQKTTPIIKL
jgi:hypothetical protein